MQRNGMKKYIKNQTISDQFSYSESSFSLLYIITHLDETNELLTSLRGVHILSPLLVVKAITIKSAVKNSSLENNLS